MIAIVGWLGSVLCVTSIVQKDQLKFRVFNLAACGAMILFNTAMGTWSMVSLNVIVAAINVRQIATLRRTAPTSIATATANESLDDGLEDALDELEVELAAFLAREDLLDA